MKANIDYSNHPLPRPRKRLPEARRHKVIVCGTDDLKPCHWKWFCKSLDRLVFGFDDPYILVRGHSDNETDKFAINWAGHNWYVLRLYYVKESRFKSDNEGRHRRDEEMISEATHLIAFYDGYCPWTERMIENAREAGLKVKVIKAERK